MAKRLKRFGILLGFKDGEDGSEVEVISVGSKAEVEQEFLDAHPEYDKIGITTAPVVRFRVAKEASSPMVHRSPLSGRRPAPSEPFPSSSGGGGTEDSPRTAQAQGKANGAQGDPTATASAVELAETWGIDLSEVKGTGADGTVTKHDVQKFLKDRDGDA